MFKNSSSAGVNQDLKVNDQQGGGIENDILLGSTGEPSDIAGIVSYLASNDSRYVTGATFDVNGGLYLT